ncbi:MAG: ABC transporter [Tenericutes bacterium HGW-Tenericutes-6]|jgi:ABC-2 type transport system ATP-binding protein|nr:MAG: ABC transporter [Tenericutes bacterium HGW-Tenericutes-6]
MIKVYNAKKYYGKTCGIEDVSMHVENGEIFGFVGPNGAGKTTLIRLLLGLLEMDDGDAFIFDEPVKMGSNHLNKDIGYMPSETHMFDDLKVKEIITFFKTMKKADQTYIDYLIERLDISLEKKFGALSFGNKKKIGIVVALMSQPKLLILDEPTSGLDPLIQSRFLELLNDAKKRGQTILLSSHVLSEIEKVCDRLALIKSGKILFTRSMKDIKNEEHKRVLVSPNYQNLHVDGLTYVKDDDGISNYTFKGDINQLVKHLSTYQFKDVTIRDIGLDELFSMYYEKEEIK